MDPCEPVFLLLELGGPAFLDIWTTLDGRWTTTRFGSTVIERHGGGGWMTGRCTRTDARSEDEDDG